MIPIEQLTVFLVDDIEDFRLIWRLLLRNHPGVKKIREAGTVTTPSDSSSSTVPPNRRHRRRQGADHQRTEEGDSSRLQIRADFLGTPNRGSQPNEWCRRGDLNPHALAGTSPSS
jgi:hypothetical protein